MALYKKDGSVFVGGLAPAGPAAAAGVQQGDELVSVDKWRIHADIDLETLEPALTGPPGTECTLRVQRAKNRLDFRMVRIPLDAIYARNQLFNLALVEGTTLLAQTANEWFGIRVVEAGLFGKDGKQKLDWERMAARKQKGVAWPVRVEWARSRTPVPLGDAAAERGVVALDIRSEDIVVGPWRIRAEPRSYLSLAGSSNLPVQVAGRDWLHRTPPWRDLGELATDRAIRVPEYGSREVWVWRSRLPQPVQSRPSLRGDLAARVRLVAGGHPIANRRIRLELDLGRLASLPGPTVTTDNSGLATLNLPPGTYFVRRILRALPGRGPDLYLARPSWNLAQIPGEGEPIEAGSGRIAVIHLRAEVDQTPTAATADLPCSALVVDPQRLPVCSLKGRPMPTLQVLRGQKFPPPMAKPNRKLLAVCMFAAEHSGGVAYAEACSEVQGRLDQAGLQTVLVSVDSMVASINNAPSAWGSGHPPVAWVGPAGREIFPALTAAAVLFVGGNGLVCDGVGADASVEVMLAAAARCLE